MRFEKIADRTVSTLDRIIECRWLDRFCIVVIIFAAGYFIGYLQFRLQ